jgi:hypothetical protein
MVWAVATEANCPGLGLVAQTGCFPVPATPGALGLGRLGNVFAWQIARLHPSVAAANVRTDSGLSAQVNAAPNPQGTVTD